MIQLKKMRDGLGPIAPLAAFALVTVITLALVRTGLAVWQWERVAVVEDAVAAALEMTRSGMVSMAEIGHLSA